MLTQTKLLLAAGLLCGASVTQAQNEIPALVEKPRSDVQITKEVKVRNMSAEIMAHWLDPVKFPQSNWDKTSIRSWVNSGHEESDSPRLMPPVPIVLPSGIRVEKVLEKQNVLQVSGNAAAMGQLETLVRQLDQPLKQIEIECEVMGVEDAALKAANLPWIPAGKTFSGAPLQQAKVNGLNQIINAWSEKRQIEKIMGPRVVAFSGLVASLQSETTTTGGLTVLPGSPQEQQFRPDNTEIPRLPGFVESLGVTVWPQIQADGSITARIQVGRNLALRFLKQSFRNEAPDVELENAAKEGRVSQQVLENMRVLQANVEHDRHFLRHAEGFEREINMHSGETLAFSGFNIEALLGSNLSKEQARKYFGKTIVAFITMREIRRLADVLPVPGT